ncbi:hypothetical protein GQ607_013744 [Colletotrichum asianum]|uniref:Uncharacterized protein n=1 Tax=Colletotrichum asianum TaxID=702518 RepID=A0A8H3W0V8_9PEZI|nr:hypothetical protein GQ607_013744 [Colletotrichum asianum]
MHHPGRPITAAPTPVHQEAKTTQGKGKTLPGNKDKTDKTRTASCLCFSLKDIHWPWRHWHPSQTRVPPPSAAWYGLLWEETSLACSRSQPSCRRLHPIGSCMCHSNQHSHSNQPHLSICKCCQVKVPRLCLTRRPERKYRRGVPFVSPGKSPDGGLRTSSAQNGVSRVDTGCLLYANPFPETRQLPHHLASPLLS